MSAVPPVKAFEHSHARLAELTMEIGRMFAKDQAAAPDSGSQSLIANLNELREELLEHFANEEEGLFPFIRQHFPAYASAVERLEVGHNAICGAIVRLAHLAAREGAKTASAITMYERFEAAYAAHSREEADLFAELGRKLSDAQQQELVELLRSLS